MTKLSRQKERRMLTRKTLKWSLTWERVAPGIHPLAKHQKQSPSHSRHHRRKVNSQPDRHSPKRQRMLRVEANLVKFQLTFLVSRTRSSRNQRSSKDLPKSLKTCNLLQSLKGVSVRMNQLRTAARHRISCWPSRHVVDKQVNSKVRSLANLKAQKSHRLNWRFKRSQSPLKSHLKNNRASQHHGWEEGHGKVRESCWMSLNHSNGVHSKTKEKVCPTQTVVYLYILLQKCFNDPIQ